VVVRASRPVSTPRWPPGAVANRNLGSAGQQPHDLLHGRQGRDHIAAPGHHQHRPVDGRHRDRPAGECDPAVRQVVAAEHEVEDLAEDPPGVAVHVAHQVVDGLDLGQDVAVVEPGEHGERLRHEPVDGAELERGADDRRGEAPDRPVDRREQVPTGDRREGAQRRDEGHRGEVDGTADHGQAAHRERVGRHHARGDGERAEDPGERPADEVRVRPGVLGGEPRRPGHHVVHPVLHAEPAVGERLGSVVDEVDGVAGGHEVLDERAAAAQIVGEVGGAERRDEQHRLAPGGGDTLDGAVPVEGAAGPLVDRIARHAAKIGDAAAGHVQEVHRGGGQVHAS
jgi:hypothetical protein